MSSRIKISSTKKRKIPQIKLSEKHLEQFNKEIEFCVGQVRLGLETQNPDESQRAEAERIIQKLQDDKVSHLERREIMRVRFGDYKTLMKKEEQRKASESKNEE